MAPWPCLGENPAMTQRNELPRTIGFWGGSSIMVGVIIGSGIFATPPWIATQMGSPAAVLGLWVVGGLLSFFGALTYAELGTLFPRSGGLYVYLNEGFGGWVAFTFGWTLMLLSKPLAASAIVLVLADHLNSLLGTSWSPPIVTCVVLVALTAINTVGLRVGAGVALFLTGVKFLALVGIVGLGACFGKGSWANFAATPSPRPVWEAATPVLYAILWTYDGWSDVAAVSGEVRDPQKNLPRIFLVGTAATIALYVAVNIVYIALVPLDQMRRLSEAQTIAPAVMERLLGAGGGKAVALLVVISTLGSSHASILTGARVTFAQAQDGLLFRFLAWIHPRFQTPAASLWVQAGLSCAAVLFLRQFQALANGFTFTMWIFYGLAALAVIVLRRKRPDLDRPYRCWGYPGVPIVFILAAAGMTALSIADSPRTTLPWVGVILAGAPAYGVWRWATRADRSRPSPPSEV
jgi:APA family basic amino acid/polyamine antiporter